MPKIQKRNKIEQCTKIFIYRDLNKISFVNLPQPPDPNGAVITVIVLCT